jgi:putative flippase GtrA
VRHPGELPGTDHPDDGQGASVRVHGAESLRVTGSARPVPSRRRPSGTIDRVAVVETVLAHIPQPYRDVAIRHRELLKFAMVGATTWVIDTAVFLVLKSTVLAPKPITAKVIAVLVATIVSYVLNREWSFRTRGGRERHHEAALFFVISGLGVAVYTAPLAISRYVLDLKVPGVSLLTQEIADFVSGQILGVLAGMAFRWWAFRRYVFPDQNVRRQVPVATAGDQQV